MPTLLGRKAADRASVTGAAATDGVAGNGGTEVLDLREVTRSEAAILAIVTVVPPPPREDRRLAGRKSR